MKAKFLSRFAALTLSAALLLTGCGGESGEAKEAETAPKEAEPKEESSTEAAAPKSELTIAISANPPSLDIPTVNSNIVGGIGIHIFESLFQMDENYEPQPVLAESYEVSEDGKVYTIKLRQGVKFHNGKEMTADDVAASMNRWLELSPKANTLIGGSVFEKVDDYTVSLTVNQPSSDIIMILASPVQFAAVYPKEVIDSAKDGMVTEYIGTGPYKFEEWKQDQYVKLTKYEDYQPASGAASGFAGAKEAITDSLVFQVVTDTATRIAGVQSHQYDIAEEIPVDQYSELSEDEGLHLVSESGGTLNLFLNTTEGIMANQKVRQAALAALNCDDIMLASYGNADLYTLNPGWCNPQDAQWGTDAGAEYYNQKNPEKAQELLKEAGYNNEEIVLVTTPDYGEMYNATLVVLEQLKAAGFNAKVESYDFSTFMEHRADPKQFSMFITSNSYNMLPVQVSVLDQGWAGLDRPEVTEGVNNIRSAKTSEEARAAWEDLQSFLYEYGAASVLGHYTGVYAMGTNVENVNFLKYPIYWTASVSE